MKSSRCGPAEVNPVTISYSRDFPKRFSRLGRNFPEVQ